MGSPRLATPQAPRGTLLVERRHLSPNLSEAPSRPSWLRLVSLAGMAGAAATALRHPCNGADPSCVRTVLGDSYLNGSRRVGGVRETRVRIQRHVDLQTMFGRSSGPAPRRRVHRGQGAEATLTPLPPHSPTACAPLLPSTPHLRARGSPLEP